MRDLLRRQKASQEAIDVRRAVLDGYQDAIEGRTTPFKGDLRRILERKLLHAKLSRTRRK